MCQVLALFIIFAIYIQDVRGGCSRIPQGASGQRSAVDDNFKILIDGNPEAYIPDHQYNVSLSCPINMKFISFTLVIEAEDQSVGYNSHDMTGHFELFNGAETKFSSGCENMIESTNTNAKTRIDVSWVAPKNPNSGCVFIKAGIVQHRDVWFIDDGFLTKRICPEEIDELNNLTPALQNCCACDEAKYEIVLESKWGRNTHAKDFPSEKGRTRIGDVIGASHSSSYRYWAYGGRASIGVQEMAEHGSTRSLEQEIRDNTQNGEVRTIIKAPGIVNRENVYGTTLANARVDPQHHQISLAAKVDPSPDWILGVAGLELCLSNCTWLERKVLNLYPWDIGTDSGPSYMSPDQPQVPPDVIRRITSSYPSDHRSPFFDESGTPMKPLATLYVTRKKLYIRECEDVPQEGPLECATHPWNDWSNCSTRCGPGYSQRFRSFKNPSLAASYNCDRHLDESRQCQGTQCGAEEEMDNGDPNNYNPDGRESGAECELTKWSDWSPCSKVCGRGFSTRTRDYFNPQARAQCQAALRMPLEESMLCTGTDCGGIIPDNGELDGMQEPEDNANSPAWNSSNNNNRFATNRNDEGQSWNSNNFDTNNDNFQSENQRRQSWNSNNFDRNIDNFQSESQRGQTWNSNNFDRNTDNFQSENQLGQTWNSNNFERNRDNFQSENQRDQSWNINRFDSNKVNLQNANQGGYNSNPRRPLESDRFNRYEKEPVTENLPRNYQGQRNDFRGNFNRGNTYQRENDQDMTTKPYDFTNNARYQNRQSDVSKDFKIVQDYCYEKPFASTIPCLTTPVIVGNFWFYDHDTHECKLFTTDNCDENLNRFRSLLACEGTCLKPQINWARTVEDDVTGELQSSGRDYGGGFGQSMSQTNNKYGNTRRGHYDS
ncbi:hypothetical protein KR215_008267 [Drosophila sulfurigaster]|nr:hypothetical protein KR215_008267 [Drosophila sulfurigaster]